MKAFIVIGRKLWALLSGRKKADMGCLCPALPPFKSYGEDFRKRQKALWSWSTWRLVEGPCVSGGTECKEDDPLHFLLEHSREVRLEETWDCEVIFWGFRQRGPGGRESQQTHPLRSLTVFQQPGPLHMDEGCRPPWWDRRGGPRPLWSSYKIPLGIPEVTGRLFFIGVEKEFGLFYMEVGVKFAIF